MNADIVIDVGCARYDDNYSIERLVEMFKPRVLYGFDPNAITPTPYQRDSTTVVVWSAAAWTYDGAIGYRNPGILGRVGSGGRAVPCRDLSRFILSLPNDQTVALKVDIEGGEYDLLRHLIATGADKRLEVAWIEWHEPDDGRAEIEEALACPTEAWIW